MRKTPVVFAIRAILATCQVLLIIGVLCVTTACMSGGGAKSSAASQNGQNALFKEWQIIDTKTGQPVSLDQWAGLLLQQDIIYLGEEHHNRFHIDAALTVLRWLKAGGRTPALAMEMFGWDGQAALDRYVSGSDMNRQEFLEAIVAHAQGGMPIIFADQSPCLLCDDLPCIAACATEALVPVDQVSDVRMGIAVVSHRLCTAGQGCHACVSRCPTQALAMDFAAMRLMIFPESCVGCGICESVCKTVNDHVAIRVTAARELAKIDR